MKNCVKSHVNTIGSLAITNAFAYDSLNRLASDTETSTAGGGLTETNHYDRYGNRALDLGGGNYSLSFNTATNGITGKTYDAAGNLTVDGSVSYGYDAENHLITVNSTLGYKYDGAGRRVRKLIGEDTRFVYGIGGALVAEFNGNTGSLTKEYVSGGGMMAVIEPATGTKYTTSDHLGSPRAVTDAAGSLVSRHDYLPFGVELGAGTSGRTTGLGYGASDGVRDKFTGYERDTETGLDYAQARYYSSEQGRFTTADPYGGSMGIANPQSFNRYPYVGNNPLRFTDPTGLRACTDASCSGNEEEEAKAPGEEDYEDSFFATLEHNSANAAPWPADTHDKILELVLLAADPQALGMAQSGSRDVDWSGDAYIPETINPYEAYKHGMVPGPWVEKYGLEKATTMAKAAAAEFTASNLSKARKLFASNKGWDNLQGLYYYGMAMHPIMDAQSPAHQWQVYSLTGIVGLDLYQAKIHNDIESRLPNRAEMKVMMAQMHGALKSVVSGSQYQKLTRLNRTGGIR